MSRFEPRIKSIISPLSASVLPKRILSLDLETRGGIKDFSKIELLVGGLVEYTRSGKYQIKAGKFESWELERIDELRDRLLEFDGLIIGMNLFGYDYRVLQRYFDVAPLVPKTLDFQHSLWRLGGGAVGLGHLAQHNTKRRKVPGGDMAKYWDRGDKRYVLKRNRVDCELTATLYFKFLETGHLSTYRGNIEILVDDVENTLIVSGVMSQYTAHEYAWRIAHHNGMRGDGKFIGLPWIAHDQYDEKVPALFFRANCPACERDTLVCCPNDKSTDDWLASICCGNCGSHFIPPTKGKRVTRSAEQYKALMAEHNQHEKMCGVAAWPGPTAPSKTFYIFASRGSFEIISNGYHLNLIPPFDVRSRRRYEALEADVRRDLARCVSPSATGGAWWQPWHPAFAYWQNKRAA